MNGKECILGRFRYEPSQIGHESTETTECETNVGTKRLDTTKFALLGSGLAPLVLISPNLCSFGDC